MYVGDYVLLVDPELLPHMFSPLYCKLSPHGIVLQPTECRGYMIPHDVADTPEALADFVDMR